MFHPNSKYLAEDTALKYNQYLPHYYFFDAELKKYILEEEMIDKLFRDKQFNAALELGVGTGRVTKRLVNKCQTYKGIDISQSMIEHVKKDVVHPNADFSVFEINDFIDKFDRFCDYDLICSFWAFNYAILSFFESEDLSTGLITPVDDLVKAEAKASNQISKLFTKLKRGAEFLFFYFDAYSVEQSYATRIMEQALPFPHNDRGYTLKVFLKCLSQLREEGLLSFETRHQNGYVELENDEHLVNYYSELHLKNYIKSTEDERKLLATYSPYKYDSGKYKIPCGLNIIAGFRS